MDVPKIIFSSEKKKSLSTSGKEYFSANDFSLTEKEFKKAQKELFETEEKKIKKLHELRNNLKSDADVNYRTDTEYLLRFLRIRKYDSTKAYQNIRKGYLFKRKHPEVTHIPPNIEKLFNRNIFMYLPYIDENGNVIFYFDLAKWKCSETSFEEVIHVISKGSDLISMNPRMQVNGLVGIWDVNELTTQHIASILSNFGLRAFSFYMQNVYPWRVKNLLVINSGLLSRFFFRMVRPFLSEKIADRVILLGTDIKELHQYIDPVLLPKKLGGFLEEDQCSITQNIIDNLSYLKYESSFI